MNVLFVIWLSLWVVDHLLLWGLQVFYTRKM